MTNEIGHIRKSGALLERHLQLVSRIYDKWALGLSRAAWYRDEEILKRIDRIGSLKPRRLLEIGPGDGRVLSRLARQMPMTAFEAVDISRRMLSLAKRNCFFLKNVQLYEGDWIEPVQMHEPFDVILIKNTLHLISDLEEKLRALARISHGKTVLVIVETVSPTRKSMEFVTALFRKIDLIGVKLNYFTKHSLSSKLRKASWTDVHYFAIVNQSMSVDDWLEFKIETAGQRTSIKNWILSAQSQIRDEMNISYEGGRLTMLRRQVIVYLRANRNRVIPFSPQ